MGFDYNHYHDVYATRRELNINKKMWFPIEKKLLGENGVVEDPTFDGRFLYDTKKKRILKIQSTHIHYWHGYFKGVLYHNMINSHGTLDVHNYNSDNSVIQNSVKSFQTRYRFINPNSSYISYNMYLKMLLDEVRKYKKEYGKNFKYHVHDIRKFFNEFKQYYNGN